MRDIMSHEGIMRGIVRGVTRGIMSHEGIMRGIKSHGRHQRDHMRGIMRDIMRGITGAS